MEFACYIKARNCKLLTFMLIWPLNIFYTSADSDYSPLIKLVLGLWSKFDTRFKDNAITKGHVQSCILYLTWSSPPTQLIMYAWHKKKSQNVVFVTNATNSKDECLDTHTELQWKNESKRWWKWHLHNAIRGWWSSRLLSFLLTLPYTKPLGAGSCWTKILQLKLQKFYPQLCHLCERECVCVCVRNGQIATNMAHINYDKMALMSSEHTSAVRAGMYVWVSAPVCLCVCVDVAFVCVPWRVFQQRNICYECEEWRFRRTQNGLWWHCVGFLLLIHRGHSCTTTYYTEKKVKRTGLLINMLFLYQNRYFWYLINIFN